MLSHRGVLTTCLTASAIVATTIAVRPAAAAILSSYEFGESANTLDEDNYNSFDVDSNSAAGNLIRSSGYGTGTTAAWTNPTSATFRNATAGDWRLYRKSQALYPETVNDLNYFNDYERAYDAGTNYLEWTITPDAGYQLNLSSFSLDVVTNNSRFFYYYLSSSVSNDSFETVIGAVGGVESASGTPVVSLAGSEFQNLTSPITFRLWTWGNQGGSSGSAWQLDDLRVFGDAVAVPEPASAMMFAGAAGLALVSRRRPA